MIGRIQRNRSIFFAAFDSESSMFADPLLCEIDVLLDDPQLVELVAHALGSRHPRSRQTGREGIAPDRALRACVLKHLKGWSFRDLERELRNGITYRQFTRFDNDKIPKYSAFCRVFALFGDDMTRKIHGLVVVRAQAEGIAPGRKLRTDTTVVESNIHYPTDSTLLADGIRAVTRAKVSKSSVRRVSFRSLTELAPRNGGSSKSTARQRPSQKRDAPSSRLDTKSSLV